MNHWRYIVWFILSFSKSNSLGPTCLSVILQTFFVRFRYYKQLLVSYSLFFLSSFYGHWKSARKLTLSVYPSLIYLCLATYGCYHPCFDQFDKETFLKIIILDLISLSKNLYSRINPISDYLSKTEIKIFSLIKLEVAYYSMDEAPKG